MIAKRLFDARNRLLGSSTFRRKAEKSFFTQWFARRQANALFSIVSGFIHSQIVLACLRLGIFDELREGARPVDWIAKRAGLPPARARHLLRAAAALDLLEKRPGDEYGLGMLGAALIDNESVTAFVEHHALLYQDLEDPVALFADPDRETRVSRLWPYALGEVPAELGEQEVESYTSLMAASQKMVAEQVLDAFSFDDVGVLLDLGGGSGAFVAAAAARWPKLQMRLVDLPGVATIARQRMAEQNLSGRVEVIGADATTEPLPGGNDVVSLVRIVHDHDDERALSLLRAARAALADDGRLLVAEPLAGRRGSGPLIEAYFNVYLLAMGSGQPRSFDDVRALLEAAGFRQVRRLRTAVPLITSVIVAQA